MASHKIILIDNYDSFSYNLKHQIEHLIGGDIDIVKNDQFDMNDIDMYDHIVLSPGPGLPDEAGYLMDLIDTYHMKKRILGICLGLQAIVEYYGGSLINLDKVYHGIETKVWHRSESIILKGLPDPFVAGRYHSWVADPAKLPNCLEISCEDNEQTIMGVEHRDHPVYGLQFHPESIMTTEGDQMIKNFLMLE